ncbi:MULTISPECIES: HD domain-containing protein [Olivibacter]|uniref:Metal dependent phosphohydrolase n=2 Tax=Sphingobacteriaceae TaxID=84566 RepID=F4C3C3_SPHS2|nr:HD domain-containing protein [Olivibacter sp. UJ_SKK_5.1]MDX3912396.1 HD domain-containing protein [Pseudosphingobacterium sp.]
MNKKKIINDPVYGFVSIPSDLIFDLIQHRYFQRLRYIKQVSLTHLVYPGALHTRFQHALGAMHLMGLALETLKGKDIDITAEEEEAAIIAILLHDIGHGPFSHSLEHTLVQGVSHEHISSLIMNEMNRKFNGSLSMAIDIFKDKYPKRFLHQLVSSQLDTDRMDYLNRDSFFTGVSEGVISFDRIIKMLNVANNGLVIEQKGIYSVEKFLIARRLMYWQVYLHKTVLSAEQMLIKILQRAKELTDKGNNVFATEALKHFIDNRVTKEDFLQDRTHLEFFTMLDDTDILATVKMGVKHEDTVLSKLCEQFMTRRLYHVELSNFMPTKERIEALRRAAMNLFKVGEDEVHYFVFTQSVENSAYDAGEGNINILMKDGTIQDITTASDLSNLEVLAKKVKKFMIAYPKELR